MESNARQRHIRKVNGQRRPRSRVGADPSGGKGNKGHHKHPSNIAPQNFNIDLLRLLKEQVVVNPINGDKQETDKVGEQGGTERQKVFEPVTDRLLEFQNHNGDNDGEHTIAKCF